MRPQAINNNSEVVGYHNTLGGDIAFKWSLEEGMEILEMPEGTFQSRAYDISDNGIIVGEHSIADDGTGPRGFIINGDEFITIEPLPGGSKSNAQAVNQQMRVVGSWGSGDFLFPLAYFWDDGVLTDLNSTFGTEQSLARDISDTGLITGWMSPGILDDEHAFIYDNGIVIDLGPTPGGFQSEARAVTDNGLAAGSGLLIDPDTGEAEPRAMMWNGSEMLNLGTLPGFLHTGASDLIETGHVVGQLWSGSPGRGFIWSDGVMTILNDLLIHDPSQDISISSAVSINSAGQIVADGSVEIEPGEYEPAMLICTPILTFGDLNGDCTVDNTDLGFLLGEWNKNTSSADLNDDGTVDGHDLGLLLGS